MGWLREWMLDRLGGVRAEVAQEWLTAAKDQADEAERRAEAARRSANRAREELKGHREAVARHLRDGHPVACPECGSSDFRDVSKNSLSGKHHVRCMPNGHISAWGDTGLPIRAEREVRDRIQAEEEEPRRRALARVRTLESQLAERE